ncbi:polysaccharide biosynthesis tyrosine autokinase [Candidatus Solincola tengchongensis]|uniref:polysaccharide biosynthesis tyrosine autokinase n=1 Tax=Candidatus Solincola tengchongensis TaxID=2900693 RepID=UPI00257CAE68|nr:polysaccharide biosynthesis tyrosine autokinase [Candidatus Solincola tengchongensis]
MELRDYLNVIARRKWIIIGATVLVVAAALVFSLLQKPLYESRVTILADINRAGESATQALYSLAYGDPNTFIQTQAEIIKTRTMARDVHDRLEYLYEEAEYDRREGKDVFIPSSLPSPEDMLARVKVDRTQNTNVFQIIFTDHNPMLARDVAQAYADEYIEDRQLSAIKQISEARQEVWNRITELEAQIQDIAQRVKQYTKETIPPELEAEASQAVNLWATLYEKYMSLRIAEALEQRGLEIIETAEPGEKVSPRTTRNAVLALFLGLILGVGLAFLADYLDVTLKTREDFEHHYGTSIIGEIPGFGTSPEEEREIIYFTAPDSSAAEGFRNLRTNVQFLNLEGETRVIMVTSASPEEGKTSVAVNLGAALSEMGKKVLVMEADLRRPVLDEFMVEKPAKGLTEVLAGAAGIEEAVISVGNTNFHLMICGVKPPNPAEMVASQSMRNLLERLRGDYDYVIVDSPPVLSVSDSVAMAPMMDGIILVASHGIAEREAARRTVELLSKVNARLLGLVINNVEAAGRYGYGYYYAPYYRYSYGASEKKGTSASVRRIMRRKRK